MPLAENLLTGRLFGAMVVRFCDRRGTAEPWIEEGKRAVKMTCLSCRRFRSNEARLWLSLVNLWRRYEKSFGMRHFRVLPCADV